MDSCGEGLMAITTETLVKIEERIWMDGRIDEDDDNDMEPSGG